VAEESTANLTYAEKKLLSIKRHIPFFNNITQFGILSIVFGIKFIKYKEDEIIFEQGSYSKDIFFILDGEVDLYIENESGGDDIYLTTLGPKNVFGEMSALTGEVRSASAVVSSEESMVLMFRLKNYDGTNPDSFAQLYKNINEVLASKLRETNAMLASL
jgi:CRP-like cAMP-binding protein